MSTPFPCPKCRPEHSDVRVEASPYDYSVCCANCYDAEQVGDPLRHVSRSMVANGKTEAEAVSEWNEQVGLARLEADYCEPGGGEHAVSNTDVCGRCGAFRPAGWEMQP